MRRETAGGAEKRERESEPVKRREETRQSAREEVCVPGKASSTATSDASRLTAVLPRGPTIYP